MPSFPKEKSLGWKQKAVRNQYRNLSEKKTLQLTWLWKKSLNISGTERYSSRVVKHTFFQIPDFKSHVQALI